VLLFLLPSGQCDARKRSIPLMDWKTANRLPWDMILLFGGGFALASGFESTQLAGWLGAALQKPLQSMPAWLVVAIVCMILIMMTELTSNVATVSAVLPTLLAMAEPLNLDPRMLFVPATLAASAGFMMPVGTPPNAIVFSSGRIPAGEMASRGLLLNILGVPILTIGTYLLIRPVMGIP
jgi:sodium-dependent dicarboxylate transporter 2/3/5